MNTEDNDSILGPGTDLIVSLFAISLILIALLSALYFESTEKIIRIEQGAQKNAPKTQQNEKRKLQKKIKYYIAEIEKFRTTSQSMKAEVEKQLRKERTKAKNINKKYEILKDRYATLQTRSAELTRDFQNIENDNSQLKNDEKTSRGKMITLNWRIENLKTRNLELEKKNSVKNKMISQLTAPSIRKGHNNTSIPKRSTKNKEVFRIYAEGNSVNPKLYYKRPGGAQRVRSAKQKIHLQLRYLKKKVESKLYVSVIVPDYFPVKHKKELQCEFWKYDYYQYFDQDYCK